MDKLISMLGHDGCRGIVRSPGGDIIVFRRRGVIDLFNAVTSHPDLMRGASVADKVIGLGAAFLLVKGGVAEVYADVISRPAVSKLQDAGISLSYGSMVEHIINREGTGICPVEQLTSTAKSPDEAWKLIKEFTSCNSQFIIHN